MFLYKKRPFTNKKLVLKHVLNSCILYTSYLGCWGGVSGVGGGVGFRERARTPKIMGNVERFPLSPFGGPMWRGGLRSSIANTNPPR